ncbi:hypothetical protein NBRC116188_13590 [Oceaniserpentilla sp. 4NH20-0058]|uniref:hypothetical protein n=1 Tax=Oceaniserpentilla sp. 4NH20-0058 TaxID=3127660 RepID=UPI003103123F
MAVDHQPTFSRTSLNLLILVCVILIVIFGQTTQDQGNIEMPPVPQLDTRIWQTDSGANVWFSPKLDEKIYIQLHYLAGFAYNQPPFAAGTSELLIRLLNHQAQLKELPIRFTLSPDFIEAEITLSTDPITMKADLDRIRQLLYRPALSKKHLNQAKQIIPSALDALWLNTYQSQPYAGPKQGTQQSVNSIHRASLQKYHQAFMHPSRLFASISGDINEQAAQVMMESLLPKRRFEAESFRLTNPIPVPMQIHANMALVPLTGSKNNPKSFANQTMTRCVIETLHSNRVIFIHGQWSNSLIIEQWATFVDAIKEEIDPSIVRKAKRLCVKNASSHTQTAQSISQLLIKLNRYHLPSNFLHTQFDTIKQWHSAQWEETKVRWFTTPTH